MRAGYLLTITTTEPIPYWQPFVTPNLQPCTWGDHTASTAARWSQMHGASPECIWKIVSAQVEIHPFRQGVRRARLARFADQHIRDEVDTCRVLSFVEGRTLVLTSALPIIE